MSCCLRSDVGEDEESCLDAGKVVLSYGMIERFGEFDVFFCYERQQSVYTVWQHAVDVRSTSPRAVEISVAVVGEQPDVFRDNDSLFIGHVGRGIVVGSFEEEHQHPDRKCP